MRDATSDYVSAAKGTSKPMATSLATQQAQQAVAEALETPEQSRRRQKKANRQWTVAIAAVSMISFLLSLATIYIEASWSVILAFIFPLFVAPYVIVQRRKLNKLPTLKFVMNKVRQQANYLMVQNKKLHVENNRLSTQVVRLNEAEDRLDQVAKKSGTNVESLCKVVEENGRIQRKMKQLQNARELQTLLSAILQSDVNKDHTLSEQEFDMLMVRLSGYSEASKTKLRDAFRMNTTASVTSLYKVATESFEQENESNFAFGVARWLFEEEDEAENDRGLMGQGCYG